MPVHSAPPPASQTIRAEHVYPRVIKIPILLRKDSHLYNSEDFSLLLSMAATPPLDPNIIDVIVAINISRKEHFLKLGRAHDDLEVTEVAPLMESGEYKLVDESNINEVQRTLYRDRRNGVVIKFTPRYRWKSTTAPRECAVVETPVINRASGAARIPRSGFAHRFAA